MKKTRTIIMRVTSQMRKRIEKEAKIEGRDLTKFILNVLDNYISGREFRRQAK